MGIRGIDLSNHQAGMDVERVVRENNIDFVFVLANDGTFKNVHFGAQVAAARRGGALVAAYLYQRPNWQQTLDTFRSQVSTEIPAIVDVEDGSGGIDECRAIHKGLWEDGRKTPLLYWPKFYWEKVGKPDLAGLPPLWKSWYPDSGRRGYDEGLRMVPDYVWTPYGGLGVKVIQFTGTGRLPGYGGDLDLNYFPGTRDELAALLGGGNEDDMGFNDAVTNHNGTTFTAGQWLTWTNDYAAQGAANSAKALTKLDTLIGLASAISTDPDLTVDQARQIVNEAVDTSTERTAQLVAAQTIAELRPLLVEVLGEDNADQADRVVDELTRRLAGGQPAGNEITKEIA